MKAKSSLRRYLSIIQGWGRKSTVSVFALCLFAGWGAFGATYTLVNLGSDSSPVEFSDLANWTVDGEPAMVLPGTDDTIDWGGGAWVYPHIALDGDYTVRSLTRSFARPAWYKSGNAAKDVVTITFATQLGGGAYQVYTVNQGTKMVIAEGATLQGATSDAVESTATVQNGGEIDVLGAVNSRHIKWVVKSGGTLYFAPTSYSQASHTGSINDVFDIANAASSIVFPNGLTVTGGNSSWANKFNHNYGTVTFGGPFTSNSPWTYEWKAGVIAATADVTFGDTISLTIPDPNPNARNITVDAAAGASFTFPASTYFGTGAYLTKTGEGDVRFVGSTLPTTTTVNAGGLALCKNDATYDLSAVTFSAGTKLKIATSGITLSATDASIANATFAALDGYIPASGATVLTCADSTVLAQAQAGLNASLASVGISVEIDGNSLVAESHYTFNSSTVSDMNDTSGWVNGLAAPAGQPAIIAGSTTEAVMDNAVPDYASIDVTDGATLTVAATRDFPELMLSAGTKLKVSPMSGTLLQSYDTCIPHSSAVVVGTMDPSASMTSLSDFSAKTAGTSFNSGSDITSILAKSLDDGETLLVQFKKHDDGHVKCAIVKFWQTDGTIYAQLVAARYWTTSASNIGHDFINADGTYNQNSIDMADTDSSRGYSIKQLSFAAPVSGEPSMVTAAGDFITTGSGSVTVDVAADCILDLSGVDVTIEATLVKTGDGTIVFGDELPKPLEVQAGVLAVQPYVEYDM